MKDGTILSRLSDASGGASGPGDNAEFFDHPNSFRAVILFCVVGCVGLVGLALKLLSGLLGQRNRSMVLMGLLGLAVFYSLLIAVVMELRSLWDRVAVDDRGPLVSGAARIGCLYAMGGGRQHQLARFAVGRIGSA